MVAAMLLFSFLIEVAVVAAASPSPSPIDDEEGLNTLELVGIIVGSIVGLLLIIVLVALLILILCCLCRKMKRHSRQTLNDDEADRLPLKENEHTMTVVMNPHSMSRGGGTGGSTGGDDDKDDDDNKSQSSEGSVQSVKLKFTVQEGAEGASSSSSSDSDSD
ncbi:PREDICTED: uncharacterized protein LOC100637576 [Amphimedon queenslandica]|uniref:Uncharacterized protein n=1 Tax=Amphimedon queenslandica TaxID=400682 RepID=A0A1X7VF24_AMPQE|nr:PREDICTED: uncharacterized protein LOC100637576 [Amphimedon queenslandica]|eukprot:XP_003384450.1 PREDICTED: uncharacterized protein LOC100637576 [Amphimedon queenslandica]